MKVTKLDTFNTNDELMDGCGYEGIFAEKGYVLTDFEQITPECIEGTLKQLIPFEELELSSVRYDTLLKGFTSRGTWKLCLVKLDERYDGETFEVME